MNWTVFGIGLAIALVGYGFLVRGKKTSVALVGAFFAVVGGWFALTAIDYGENSWAQILISIIWFLAVGITLLKAPADGTTLLGFIAVLIAVAAASQTYPINELDIPRYLGDALDVAKRTWDNIFGKATN